MESDDVVEGEARLLSKYLFTLDLNTLSSYFFGNTDEGKVFQTFAVLIKMWKQNA